MSSSTINLFTLYNYLQNIFQFRYTCEPGFIPDGKTTMTCNEGGVGDTLGVWSNDTPSCNRKFSEYLYICVDFLLVIINLRLFEFRKVSGLDYDIATMYVPGNHLQVLHVCAVQCISRALNIIITFFVFTIFLM